MVVMDLACRSCSAPGPPADPAAQRGEAVRCASSDDATPNGLAVVIPPGEKGYKSGNLEVLKNPFMRGVAVQINWRDIEPVQGNPDWSKLDALFAAAASSQKWVQLDIFGGFFSPEWALAGAKTDSFPIPYGPDHGSVARLPMPWDPVYLGRWFAFMKQLSERYGRSPAFRIIAAGGPTSVSEEMTLPSNSPAAVKKWLSDGYTPAKYLGAWEKGFFHRSMPIPFPISVFLWRPRVSQFLSGGNPVLLRVCRQSKNIVERAGRKSLNELCFVGREVVEDDMNQLPGRAQR